MSCLSCAHLLVLTTTHETTRGRRAETRHPSLTQPPSCLLGRHRCCFNALPTTILLYGISLVDTVQRQPLIDFLSDRCHDTAATCTQLHHHIASTKARTIRSASNGPPLRPSGSDRGPCFDPCSVVLHAGRVQLYRCRHLSEEGQSGL